MSLFGKLFHRHEDEFNIDDIPMDPIDPAESQRNVDHFLADINPQGNTNSSQPQSAFENPAQPQSQSAFENPVADPGLPPDPNQPSAFDEHLAKTQPTMPSGESGSDLANKYMKQQEYLAKQEQINTQHQGIPKQNQQEEIVNLKLDAMKHQLDAINQRMLRIEQLLSSNNRKW